MPTKFYSALQVHEASVMYYYIHSFASFSCALMDSAAVEVYFTPMQFEVITHHREWVLVYIQDPSIDFGLTDKFEFVSYFLRTGYRQYIVRAILFLDFK